jgi:hypothetical protein
MRSYLGCIAIGLISAGLLIVRKRLGRSSNGALENLYVEGGSQSYTPKGCGKSAFFEVLSQSIDPEVGGALIVVVSMPEEGEVGGC